MKQAQVELCPFSAIEKDIDNQGYVEYSCLKCGARNDMPCQLSESEKVIQQKEAAFNAKVIVFIIAFVIGAVYFYFR